MKCGCAVDVEMLICGSRLIPLIMVIFLVGYILLITRSLSRCFVKKRYSAWTYDVWMDGWMDGWMDDQLEHIHVGDGDVMRVCVMYRRSWCALELATKN